MEETRMDPRPLVEHRLKDCHCISCSRHLARLPPPETTEERIASYRIHEKEVKRAKKKAKKAVKKGKQATIQSFLIAKDKR